MNVIHGDRDTIPLIVAVYLERLTLENMYILKHNFIWNTGIYLTEIQLLFLSRRTFYFYMYIYPNVHLFGIRIKTSILYESMYL